jgi:putative Holliday junction resolvase
VRIGVDVGAARVGVAASDPSGTFASPVQTLRRDLGTGEDLAVIERLVVEREAIEVIVGLPRLLSGEEGEAARLAREYAAQLAKRIAPVPVLLVDERLTTVDAHKRLRESGVPGRGQRSVVDQAAAVLILQSALDAEAVSGRPAGMSISPARKPRKKKERHR